ncbi:hypothetical protein G6F65_014026 [Rhizopus arrhizus]|nr:hypothetical protein G6F65_014026 [Rhizopus arrhizus]
MVSALPSRLRNRRALDLDQQPGPRKLAHADARPRTPAAGKRPVLDGAEHVHVGGHVDVVGRHVHHVLERAAGLGEHHAQVFPGRGELRLRIRDDLQIRRPAHLPGAIDRVPDLHRRRVAGPVRKRLHRIGEDDLSVGHGKLNSNGVKRWILASLDGNRPSLGGCCLRLAGGRLNHLPAIACRVAKAGVHAAIAVCGLLRELPTQRLQSGVAGAAVRHR